MGAAVGGARAGRRLAADDRQPGAVPGRAPPGRGDGDRVRRDVRGRLGGPRVDVDAPRARVAQRDQARPGRGGQTPPPRVSPRHRQAGGAVQLEPAPRSRPGVGRGHVRAGHRRVRRRRHRRHIRPGHRPNPEDVHRPGVGARPLVGPARAMAAVHRDPRADLRVARSRVGQPVVPRRAVGCGRRRGARLGGPGRVAASHLGGHPVPRARVRAQAQRPEQGRPPVEPPAASLVRALAAAVAAADGVRTRRDRLLRPAPGHLLADGGHHSIGRPRRGLPRAHRQRGVPRLVHAPRRRDVDERACVADPNHSDQVDHHRVDPVRDRFGPAAVAADGHSARARRRRQHAGLDQARGARGPPDLRRGRAANLERRLPRAAARRRRDRRTRAARRRGRRRRAADPGDEPGHRRARPPLPADAARDRGRSLLAGVGSRPPRRPRSGRPGHLSGAPAGAGLPGDEAPTGADPRQPGRAGQRRRRLPRVPGLARADDGPQPAARRVPARAVEPTGRDPHASRATHQSGPRRPLANGPDLLLLRPEHEPGELAGARCLHQGQLHRAPVLVLLRLQLLPDGRQRLADERRPRRRRPDQHRPAPG